MHRALLWITLVAVVACSGWLELRDMRPADMQAFHAVAPAIPAAMQLVFSSSGAAHEPTGRLFYPYSVVPGGVATVAELRTAIERDPVVAAHYAGFDVSKAQVTHADRERMVYVSYRRGNHLYWTTHKLKLAKGEKLITDGTITARSRCGNQVSDIPMPMTSPSEPSPKTLDTPQPVETSIAWLDNPDHFSQLDWGSDLTTIWQPPPSGAGAKDPEGPTGPGPANLPLFFPPAGGSSNSRGGNVSDPSPVVPVPEPSSLALLLVALPAVWAFRKRKA